MMYRNASTDTLAIETATAVVRVEPGAEIAIAPSKAQHYLDLGLLVAVESGAVESAPAEAAIEPEPTPDPEPVKPRTRRTKETAE